MRLLVSGVFCGRSMKVIRDPENWERTGLYRLAIRDRDCRHPVWTQAGSGRRLDRTLKASAPLGRGCRHWRLLLGKRKSHRQTGLCNVFDLRMVFR